MALALGGCSGNDDDDQALLWAGDPQLGRDGGAFGVRQSDLAPGATVSFGSVVLCVKGADAAVIESVHFKDASHLQIQRFAVRTIDLSKQGGLGGSRKGIAAEGFALDSRTVNTPCPVAGAVTEMGMDFTADAAGNATGQTLVLAYRIADRKPQTTEIPMTVAVCSATCPHNLQ